MIYRRQRVGRTQRRGFTVVEVMIASAILVIGFAAIIALLGQSNRVHRHSLDISRASMLADEVFEDIAMAYDERWTDANPRNGTPDIIERTESDARWKDGPELPKVQGMSYSVTYQTRRVDYSSMPATGVRATGSDGRELLVQVEVFWLESGDEKSFKATRVVLLGGTSPLQN